MSDQWENNFQEKRWKSRKIYHKYLKWKQLVMIKNAIICGNDYKPEYTIQLM